jgi:hypothetical protein
LIVLPCLSANKIGALNDYFAEKAAYGFLSHALNLSTLYGAKPMTLDFGG